MFLVLSFMSHQLLEAAPTRGFVKKGDSTLTHPHWANQELMLEEKT